MADKEDLARYIADTLRKEIVIDAPPQRVISSSSFRKTRSHPRQKDKTNDVILLLDSNVWANIRDLSAGTAQTKYKGNIDFFKGIIKQSKAYERKKIYTFSPEGTFFGQPFYEGSGVTFLIQSSVLLTQYVFSPLGIEVIAINDTDINQVDSTLWFPLFVLGILIGDPFEDPDNAFLWMPLQFPEEVISPLTRIAKKFGIILQGEHSAWFAHNNYYLETFNKRYQSDWRFTSTTYPRNWVSQDKKSKEAVITTNLTHGMPLNQLDKRMRALATFEWSGVEYAGAIAWEI